MSPEDQYSQAADRMDQLVDKGRNPDMAWREVDPTGALRKAEEERQRQIQDGINHIGARAAQQVGIDRELARIEAIADPEKRESERTYYLARQKAKQHIRERGF